MSACGRLTPEHPRRLDVREQGLRVSELLSRFLSLRLQVKLDCIACMSNFAKTIFRRASLETVDFGLLQSTPLLGGAQTCPAQRAVSPLASRGAARLGFPRCADLTLPSRGDASPKTCSSRR